MFFIAKNNNNNNELFNTFKGRFNTYFNHFSKTSLYYKKNSQNLFYRFF